MSNPNIWYWPVPGVSNITSKYGNRSSGYHSGLDIGASNGTNVVATRDGTVIDVVSDHTDNYGKNVGDVTGYGNRVYIDHGDGYVSRYAHLSKVYVRKGEKVKAGTVIGAVGSTGNSTGFHLHFEILMNNQAMDPEIFVSPNGPSAVTPDYNPNISNNDSSANYQGISGGTTVGQRVSGVTPQPVHAYINIWLGDKLLATNPARPNVIQSFEYARLEGSGETATFTLFDNNWYEIEYYLSENFNNIWIEYGYYGTGVKSKLSRHLLKNYSISFESTGIILSVESITEDTIDNLKQISMVLDTFNPTVAVKAICRRLGYTVLDENFDSSQDIHADNPFNLVEDFPITYIQRVIIPQASQENEELFRFIVDSDGVAYFKRITYTGVKTDSLRTYIYQKGYDSNVIDFTVDIKGVFAGSGTLELATGYRSSVFDTKNKTQESLQLDKYSVITEATGDITHTKSNQSVPLTESSGYTTTQMSNRLYYYLKSDINSAYEATLTILGDPTIDYINDQYIRIINVTDDGYLHHTSGVYRIKGIVDSIQGGEMTTTLKLARNAESMSIDGIEIINPKYLIK